MNQLFSTPNSLKFPGMLDEPVGSLPLHLESQLSQPIARRNEGSSLFLLPLDRGTSSVRVKNTHKTRKKVQHETGEAPEKERRTSLMLFHMLLSSVHFRIKVCYELFSPGSYDTQ
jgi:hypothetical protein